MQILQMTRPGIQAWEIWEITIAKELEIVGYHTEKPEKKK